MKTYTNDDLRKAKPLVGCVLCAHCANRIDPYPYAGHSSLSMKSLNYSGCAVNGKDWLVFADRKCNDYKEANEW